MKIMKFSLVLLINTKIAKINVKIYLKILLYCFTISLIFNILFLLRCERVNHLKKCILTHPCDITKVSTFAEFLRRSRV